MQLICGALIDISPVHGIDLVSYRTAEDMAYEWIQHNIVYTLPMVKDYERERARSVDLDPQHQNQSLLEMYITR